MVSTNLANLGSREGEHRFPLIITPIPHIYILGVITGGNIQG